MRTRCVRHWDVIGRHESLRTMYPMINGVPVQVIESTEAVAPQVDVPVTDLTGSDEVQVAAAVAAVTDKGFDVTAAVPIRAALLRLGPEEHIVSLVVHHISVDGASTLPLAKDPMMAYDARHGGDVPRWAPLTVQFADYAVWSAERLAAEDDGVTERDRQLAYWADRLDGAPGVAQAAHRPAAADDADVCRRRGGIEIRPSSWRG